MSHIQLLVGTTKGLFIYHSDNKQHWQLDGPHLNGWSIDSVFGEGRHSRRIFAGVSHTAYGPTIRLSEDGGQTWTQLLHGPRFTRESGLALRRIWQITPGASTQPDIYYAGVDEAGLFISQDCGLTWHEIVGLNQHPTRAGWRGGRGGLCLHTILIDPSEPRRLWVAISGVGILRSEDEGETWQICNTGMRPLDDPGRSGPLVHKLALDPHNPNVLYLQDFDGVYHSVDGGDSWQPLEEGLPSRFGFPLCVNALGDLYTVPLDVRTRCCVDGQLRVYRRMRDEGEWQPLGAGLPDEPQYVGVLRDALAVDALSPAGVYLGTTQGELFHSPDRGEHWARLPGQLARITALQALVVENP